MRETKTLMKRLNAVSTLYTYHIRCCVRDCLGMPFSTTLQTVVVAESGCTSTGFCEEGKPRSVGGAGYNSRVVGGGEAPDPETATGGSTFQRFTKSPGGVEHYRRRFHQRFLAAAV